jgi:hypothetical protein
MRSVVGGLEYGLPVFHSLQACLMRVETGNFGHLPNIRNVIYTHTHTHTHIYIYIYIYIYIKWAGIAQSVQRLATGWTVRGSNPGGGKIFRTLPDRPWGLPSLLYNGYRVFPGVKRRGRGDEQRPPSSAEVKERVEL